MFLSHPTLSLMLFAIVLVGAKKVFAVLVKMFAFSHASEAKRRRAAFMLVGTSIALMAAPLIIPFGGPFRLLVALLYMLYIGCGLWQVWAWYYGSDRTETSS
ncbi:MAG: hypothetical protein SFV17_27555 [Candidatus Obscuribacter sp.]|nr:hypothetical protein [Candidatus Obscuribacter sp.]